MVTQPVFSKSVVAQDEDRLPRGQGGHTEDVGEVSSITEEYQLALPITPGTTLVSTADPGLFFLP